MKKNAIIIIGIGLLYLGWSEWHDYWNNRADFIIEDVSKPHFFSFTSEGSSLESLLVTINGKFDGKVKMAAFYGGENAKYNIDSLETMIFQDSVNISWPYDESYNGKHDFYFTPMDAKKGKITIKVR